MIKLSLDHELIDSIRSHLDIIGGCSECCTMIAGEIPVYNEDTPLYDRLTMAMVEKASEIVGENTDLNITVEKIIEASYMLICDEHYEVFKEDNE